MTPSLETNLLFIFVGHFIRWTFQVAAADEATAFRQPVANGLGIEPSQSDLESNSPALEHCRPSFHYTLLNDLFHVNTLGKSFVFFLIFFRKILYELLHLLGRFHLTIKYPSTSLNSIHPFHHDVMYSRHIPIKSVYHTLKLLTIPYVYNYLNTILPPHSYYTRTVINYYMNRIVMLQETRSEDVFLYFRIRASVISFSHK